MAQSAFSTSSVGMHFYIYSKVKKANGKFETDN